MRAFHSFRAQAAARNTISLNGQYSRLQWSTKAFNSPKACQMYHTKPISNLHRPSPSLLQSLRSLVFRRFHQIRKNSTNGRPLPDPTPHLGSPEPSLSLSQRMRKLSREYGWAAVGVYLGLSALDFPFCFLAVRLLGTDRIGHWEHVIVSNVKGLLSYAFPQLKNEEALAADGLAVSTASDEPVDNWGVDEATKSANSDDATIWTQLVLAYAIHKSFIFIRVPLTAAVTPKVVKTLRGWGWDIGKRRPKTGTIASKKD